MNKLLLIVCMALCLLMPASLAVIDITETSLDIQGNVSQTVPGTFFLNNTGNESVYVQFSNYTLTSGPYSMSIYSIPPTVLGPLAGQYVTFSVYIPANQYASVYTGHLVASSGNETANFSDSVQVNLQVMPAYDASLLYTMPNVIQGFAGFMNFSFINTGNTNESIDYSTSDLTLGSNTIPFANTAHVNVAYNKTANTTIPFVTTNQTPGTYTATVNLTVNGVTNKSYTIYARVIPATKDFTFAPASLAATAVRSLDPTKTATLRITNNGTLALSDIFVIPSGFVLGNATISASANPAAFSLESLANRSVDITFTIPSDAAIGTYNGNVTITSPSANLTKLVPATITVRAPVMSMAVSPNPVTLPETTRNSTTSTTFLLQNTGDMQVNNIVLNASMGNGYTAAFTGVPSYLASGANATISVSVTIPQDSESGMVTVGTIKFTGNEANATATLRADITSMLDITDLDVTVDGDTDNGVTNGDRIKYEAKPGSEVNFDAQFKNLYSSSSDIDISDIEVTVTIEEIDDGEDLEEDLDTFDLSPNRDKRVNVKFTIPEKVEEDTYNVVIHAEGEDDDGNTQEVEWTVELQVTKESHDVIITKAELADTTLTCDRTTSLSVNVLNVGKRDEDEARFTATAGSLGINIDETFEVTSDAFDSDAEFSRTYTITVPDSVAAGTYPITMKAYYDPSHMTDEDVVYLTIAKCTEPAQEPEQPDEEIPPTTPPTTEPPVVTEPTTPPTSTPTGGVDSVESSFTDSPYYIAILVTLNVILIILIIVFLVKLVSRR